MSKLIKTLLFRRTHYEITRSRDCVGKSTLYQFIQAMLFGFPTKGKRKRDYAPKNGGSYGGRLWLAHPVFGEVQVERFKEKNKGQAIIYYQQQMGDEKTLQQMLHPLTKKLFRLIKN